MLNKFLTYTTSTLTGVALLASLGTKAISEEPKILDSIREKVEYLQTFKENHFKSKGIKDWEMLKIILNDNDYEEIHSLSKEEYQRRMKEREPIVSDGFMERVVINSSLDDPYFSLFYLKKDLMATFYDQEPYGFDFNTKDFLQEIQIRNNQKIVTTMEGKKIVGKKYVNGVKVDGNELELKEVHVTSVNEKYERVLDYTVRVLKQRYGGMFNENYHPQDSEKD